MAKEKDKNGIKSGYFWGHIGTHVLVLGFLLWNYHLWPVLVSVSLGHLIVDAIKTKIPNTAVWVFILDQFLHLLLIVGVWVVATGQSIVFFDKVLEQIYNQKLWWIVLAYILVTIPTAVLMGKLTDRWAKELDELNDGEKNKGLENAGKWIGILERILILTFILINELRGIGFLLAAKSVFRFGDLKNASEHKKTEYIIIGTFLSFSI